METLLRGRIGDLSFKPKRDILVPLYEAFANSLESIILADKTNGKIDITITRDTRQGKLEIDDATILPIQDILIVDNGYGFNEENFTAFQLLNTDIKKAKFGCKGVGRLFWLKAFESAKISSCFLQNGKWMHRNFTFDIGWPENKADTLEEKEGTQTTSVKLVSLKDQFKPYSRKKLESIKKEILKHFLSNLVLLGDKCPSIMIHDGSDTEIIDKDTLPQAITENFEISGRVFQIKHMKTDLNEEDKHCVHYCASNRVVKTDSIEHFTKKKLFDEDGSSYYYTGYVSSDYLDTSVNTERSDFSIDDDTQKNLYGDIGWNDINQNVVKNVQNHLSTHFTRLNNERKNTIDQILENELPQLQYIKESNALALDDISVDASKETIKERIGLIHFKNQSKAASSIKQVIGSLDSKDIKTYEDFEKQYIDEIKQFSKVNEANLGSYILYRKTILDIFAKALTKIGDSYEYEKTVHNLVFPRLTDSDNARDAYSKHNLWILDDRFAFYDYVASDLAFNKHKVISSDSIDKPDIALYYNLSFAADINNEIQTIVLVEFKRPGREHYDKDPTKQIMEYIQTLQQTRKDELGRQLLLNDKARFYGYIICDTNNDKMRQYIKLANYKTTPDGHGYYYFHEALNAYLEIIPFSKLLKDAKERNEVFFKKIFSH